MSSSDMNGTAARAGGGTETDYTSLADYRAAVVIWKVVPPIIIVFGTVGNILSIIVLTRRSIRTSTISLYLTVLAFADLVVLYTGLLRQWINFRFDTDIRRLSNAGCKVHIWLVYTSLDFSAWLLMAVTLERVISAWWPHKARSNCTRKPAVALISAVGMFLLALNSHMLYGMGVHKEYDSGGNVIFIGKCSEINEEYSHFFNVVWPWIDLCAFCVLPLSVIVVGNACVIFKVLKSQRKTQSAVVPTVRSGTSGVRHRHVNGGKNSSMTAMLFTLNTVFLITTSPVSVYNIGYTHWLDGATAQQLAELDLWWAIVNMLMYTNNSLNFFLYCLSGTRFRQEVAKLFFSRRGETFSIFNHTRSHIENTTLRHTPSRSVTPSPVTTRSKSVQIPVNTSMKQSETSLSNGRHTNNNSPIHDPYSGNSLNPLAARSAYHTDFYFTRNIDRAMKPSTDVPNTAISEMPKRISPQQSPEHENTNQRAFACIPVSDTTTMNNTCIDNMCEAAESNTGRETKTDLQILLDAAVKNGNDNNTSMLAVQPANNVSLLLVKHINDATTLSVKPTNDVFPLSEKPINDMCTIFVKPTDDVSTISGSPTNNESPLSWKFTPDVSLLSVKPTNDVSPLSVNHTNKFPLSEKPIHDMCTIFVKPTNDVSTISGSPTNNNESPLSGKFTPDVSLLSVNHANDVSPIPVNHTNKSPISGTPTSDLSTVSLESANDVVTISVKPTKGVSPLSVTHTSDATPLSVKHTNDMSPISGSPTSDFSTVSLKSTNDVADIKASVSGHKHNNDGPLIFTRATDSCDLASESRSSDA